MSSKTAIHNIKYFVFYPLFVNY